MTQPGIEPQAVRTPIQLLGAWWAGLILIDTAFLTAATQIQVPTWAAGALVMAAIIYVPIVILLLFYMQTRFRTQLLTGPEYLKHLEITASQETGRLQIVSSVQTIEPLQGASQAQISTGSACSGISINDLLPRFNEIVATLKESGIKIDDTFGSTSADSEIPRRFIVTVGRSFDIPLMQRVLAALSRFDLEGIYLSLREQNEDKLYIGAYNYRMTPERVHTYSSELALALLEPSLTRKKLFQLLSWKDTSFEPVLDEYIDAPD